MGTLTTVLGPVPAGEAGHFQVHEHIFVRATPAAARNPALRIDDEGLSLAELRRYRDAGGGTLVDCQPGGAGRDARALRRLSAESGVHIVAVTGYHLPAFYPPDHWIFTRETAALREHFLSELCEGMEGGARAGAVKAAIGAEGPVGRFLPCLRAASGAAAAAGVPLILHTERGIGAVEAVRLCEAEGLAPERIAVCHADRRADDFSVHEEIARSGAFLEYDTIARPKYHDDASERKLILHMLEFGCAGRLLLSLDTTAERLQSYAPQAPGLDFLLRAFLPQLRGEGVDEATLDRITRQNPLRLFGLI